MGHLLEKKKICHGYQGNYHSERREVGRRNGGGESLPAFTDEIRL